MAAHNIYNKLTNAPVPATGTMLEVTGQLSSLFGWGNAAPVNGTDIGLAPGAFFQDTLTPKAYTNTGTKASPTWTDLTAAGSTHAATTNLKLNDDITFTLGTGDDMVMEWDTAGTPDMILVKPKTDDYEWYWGNTSGNLSLKMTWQGSTNAATMIFNPAVDTLKFTAINVLIQDDAILQFGDTTDIQFSHNGTDLIIWPYVNDTGVFTFGKTSYFLDVRINMGATATYVLFDNTLKLVQFEGTTLRMMDDDNLEFGDNADVTMAWDGSNFNMLPLTDNTGVFNIGDGTTDMDVKWFAASAAAYVLCDNDAQLVTFEGVDLRIMDDDLLELGDGAAATFMWETADANANALLLELPAGGGVDVPVFAIGIGVKNQNLGHFNGITVPTFAVLDADRDSYVKIDSSADDIPRISVGGAGGASYLLASTEIRFADDVNLSFGDTTEVVFEYDEDGTNDFRASTIAALGVGYAFTAGTGAAGDNAGGGWTVLGGVGGAAAAASSGDGGPISITAGTGAAETTGAAGNGGASGLTAGAGGATSGAGGTGGPGGTVTITAGTGGADSQGGSGTGGNAGNVVLKLGDLGAGNTPGTAGLIQFLPTTTDSGAVNIGNGTLDMDLKIFMDSTNAFVNFDQASQTVVFEGTTINLMDDDALLFGDASEFSIDYDDAGTDDLRFIAAADKTLGFYFIAGTGADGATNAGGIFDVTSGAGGAGAGAGTGGAGGAIGITSGAGGTETTGTAGAGGAIVIDSGGGANSSGAGGTGGAGGAITIVGGTGGNDTEAGTGTGGNAADIRIQLGDVGTGSVAGTAGVIKLLPTATDVGAVNVGNGTIDMDFKVFMDSVGAYVNFDQSAQLVIFEGTDAQFMDDDLILFGDLSGGDATLGYGATPHALILDPIGSHVALPGLSHRLELRHQFGGVEGSIPQTIGSYAVDLLTDQQWILSGTGIADGSAVASAEGGVLLAVQAGDGNEAIVIPNSTAGCVFDDVTWGTDQETRFECLITTTAGIANCIIWAGLKLTETEVMITDADQAYFRYENGVNGGKWEAITSVANSDDNHDTAVTVATTTTYHLVIAIDSSRVPKYYIDGVLVETGSALTSTDFIPYIGVADDGGAVGNSILIRSIFMARNYA